MNYAAIGQLEPPHVAFEVVPTSALMKLIEGDAPSTKVVSVVAPTGYGKTMLLVAAHAHYEAQGATCRWLSLRDREVDLEPLLILLEEVLASDNAVGQRLNGVLHEGDAPVSDRLDALAAVASQLPNPSVIFLDNISYCADETLGPVLDALIFNTPSWVHIVTSGISEPPFHRSRLMLQGELAEIDFGDLRMSEDQVRQLFGKALDSDLGDDGIARAIDLTEGWPAALRLTQILLDGEDRPHEVLNDLTGSNRELASLLNEQVLERFGPDLRAFLSRIAPLERFEAGLCEAVTGDANAAAHIETLLSRNALVIPLDKKGQWYRLHGLLREHILEQATRRLDAEEQAALLHRASTWFEQNGYWSEAVQHALAAGANEHAVALVERVAAMLVRDRGNLRNYIEWVEALHAANASVGRETQYWYVWALIFHRRYEFAKTQVKPLKAQLQALRASSEDSEAVEEFDRRVQVIQISLEVYTDQAIHAQQMAETWLESRKHDDNPFDVATVSTAAAIAACGLNEFVTARRHMQAARSAISQSDSEYGLAWVYLLSALVPVFEGDYVAAFKDLKACLKRAEKQLGDNAGITGSIALVAAKAAVMQGQTDEARTLFRRGLRKFDSHGLVETAACGLQAGVLLWDGRDDEIVSIGQLRELADSYPPRLAFQFSCFLIQRLIQLDRLDEAEQEAQRIGLLEEDVDILQRFGERARSVAALALIDLAIAAGQLRSAARQIEQETALAKKQGRYGHQVELALADMTVAICSHNSAPAARHLIRAISIAVRRGIYRPFHDRKTMLAGLVNETKPQSWGFANEDERRFFGEICKGLPLENSALLEQLGLDDDDASMLQTPTPRELELIGLIESGLTNQQIADRLSVSVATVKWHLYNLYGKLGVSNRSAALARAKALNLLAR